MHYGNLSRIFACATMNPVMKIPEFSEAEKTDTPDTIIMPSEVALLENDDDVIKLIENTVGTLSVHALDAPQAREKVKQLLEGRRDSLYSLSA